MRAACSKLRQSDEIENRIFFEMTGRRRQSGDFPSDEETDEEYDMILRLRDALGYEESNQDEEGQDDLVSSDSSSDDGTPRQSIIILNNDDED